MGLRTISASTSRPSTSGVPAGDGRRRPRPAATRLSWAVLAATGALALALAGCGSGSGVRLQPGGSPAPAGVDGRWTLVAGSGPAGTLRLVAGRPVTLIVDGDAVSGSAACNSYGGRVTRRGGGFVVEDALAMTEMACPDGGVMDLESGYLTALQRVRTATAKDESLVLRGAGVELTFSRQAPVPDTALEATTWELTTLYDGETASSAAGNARLLLDGTGGLSGSTGCRDLTASYRLDGGTLTLTRLTFVPASAAECSVGPRGQDAAMATVLGAPMTVELTGPSLTLMAGTRGLGLRAAPGS